MGRNELLPTVNEKLDTERATTGKLSEGATSVDVPVLSAVVMNCIWPSSPLNGGLKSSDIHWTSYTDC